MKEIKKENGVVVTLNDVNVEQLYKNEVEGANGQKQTRVSAWLTQKRLTAYPARRMDTGFGDGLFETVQQDPYEQTRNTLVSVPEDADIDKVKEQLGQFEEACIYRILSNNLDDVISEREISAIDQGFITKESLKPRYILRDSEGNIYANYTQDGEILKGDARIVGKIVEDNGEQSLELTNPNAVLEFKRDIFSREYVEDKDMREHVEVKQPEAQLQA